MDTDANGRRVTAGIHDRPDADGHVATPFVSEGMKRAVLERDGTLTSAAF
jgi:isoaspartyl peptidase/L-asparaginase-like protein (Ntn-hydrolase superfamily)